MKEDEAWVQYHLLGTQGAERWVAVVVRRGAIQWFTGHSNGLTERLDSLKFQMDAVRGSHAALLPHANQLMLRTRRHLQALHARYWQPLVGALSGVSRVFIAPHRGLHYVPFAALHDGEEWLVEQHEVCLAQSARQWSVARSRPGDHSSLRGQLLALGVGGPNLPEVRNEVEAVARQFGDQAIRLLDERRDLPGPEAARPPGRCPSPGLPRAVSC